jgi:hypothetical protein
MWFPTGIYTEEFARGAGKVFRKKLKSLLMLLWWAMWEACPEKNLEFVTHAVAKFLKKRT